MIQARVAAILLAVAACEEPGMTAERTSCVVVDAEKLPAAVGGADAICSAIERATAATNADGRYRVEVRVISSSRLAATAVTGKGEKLPETNFAVMDRELNASSIRRFAETLAKNLLERR